MMAIAGKNFKDFSAIEIFFRHPADFYQEIPDPVDVAFSGGLPSGVLRLPASQGAGLTPSKGGVRNAMSIIINHGKDSQSIRRILRRSGLELSSAIERLSSGLRINSAADDPGGLSVVTRLGARRVLAVVAAGRRGRESAGRVTA